MSQPHEQAQGVQTAKKKGPAYAKLYLDGLADDATLHAPEKLAIAVLLNFQRVAGGGFVFVSYEKWAARLGLSTKHLKRLVRLLNGRYDKGETEWRVLVRYRKFGGRQPVNAFKTRIPPDVIERWRRARGDYDAPVANDPPGGAPALPPTGAPPIPLPGARALPIKEGPKKNFLKSASGDTGLFTNEPARVNLFAASGGRCLAETLAKLIESGDVAFALWEGRWRGLSGAIRQGTCAELLLASEEEPDAFEAVRVSMRQLGGMRFGR